MTGDELVIAATALSELLETEPTAEPAAELTESTT
jgi:hypothetical protein